MMANQAIRRDRAEQPAFEFVAGYDRVILVIYLVLISLGLVMVASSSIGIADQHTGDPFFYAKRQFLRILLSLALVWFAARVAGFNLIPSRPKLTPDLKRLAIIAAPAALAGGVVQVSQLPQGFGSSPK